MSIVNKDCLYSTVKNTSGGTKRFGFLPPHGVQLAADGEYTVFGNILEALVRSDRATERRNFQAFSAALDRGDITIVATPAPVLVSPNGTIRIIRVADNGTLSSTDPCWDASDSEAGGDPIGHDDRLVPA